MLNVNTFDASVFRLSILSPPTVLFVHQTNHLPKVVCFSSTLGSLDATAALTQLSGARRKPSVSRCPGVFTPGSSSARRRVVAVSGGESSLFQLPLIIHLFKLISASV